MGIYRSSSLLLLSLLALSGRTETHAIRGYDPVAEEVLAVTMDEQGLLWLVLHGGLYRFDGHRLRSLDQLYPGLQVRGTVSRLLWVGSVLWCADGAELVSFEPAASEVSRLALETPITALLATEAGLWVGTTAGLGLVRSPSNQWEPIHGSSGVTALLGDKAGRVWVAGNDGLGVLPPGSQTITTFDTPALHGLVSTANDTLWALGQERLLSFSCNGPEVTPLKNSPMPEVGGPLGLSAQADGRIFVIGRRQLGYLQPYTDTIEGIPFGGWRRINQTYTDPEAGIWLATDRGLFSYDTRRERFHFHRPLTGANGDGPQLNGISLDSDQSLWLATNEGLFWYDAFLKQGKHFLPEAAKPPARAVHSVLHLEDGAQLLGTAGGLFVLEPDATTYRKNLASPDQAVTVLAFAPGGYWAGTAEALLRLDQTGNQVASFAGEPALPITHLAGNPGKPLVGTAKGLMVPDPASGSLIAASDQLVAGPVYHLGGDGDNGYLVAVPAGLYHLDAYYQILEHRVLRAPLAATIDDDGGLWVAQTRGLRYFKDGRDGFLGREHGFSDTNFIGALSRESGTLIFATRSGVLWFDPDTLQTEAVTPVLITEQQGRAAQTEVRLEGSSLEMAFSNRYYLAPATISYRYRLQGVDEDWVATPHAQAHYAALPPGRYNFEVTARTPLSDWSQPSRTVVIVPGLPRAWFLGLGWLLALIALIFLLRRRKVVVHREEPANIDEVLAITTHELRTPLNGMIGMTEAIMVGLPQPLPDEIKKQFELIRGSGRRMSRLLARLNDFSSLDRGRMHVELAPVRVQELAEEAILLRRNLLPAGLPLELSNQIPPDFPAVHADMDRVMQILGNLLDNAIKYGREGVVGVDAQIDGEQRAVFRVTDTGPGISEENLKKIFTPFTQLESVTTRDHGGMGIGLSVVKNLVEAMGGEVWVESVVGMGSNFCFSLRLADEDSDSFLTRTMGNSELVQPTSMPLSVTATTTLEVFKDELESLSEEELSSTLTSSLETTRKILVVDDYEINRQVLVTHLTGYGYLCVEADSGARALKLLAREPFDLVILDVMMPGLSGFEVCRQLRASHALEALPIIFLTARERGQDVVRGFEAGGNDYLIKPVSRHELLARVNLHLQMGDINRLLLKAQELERVKRLNRESELRLLHTQMKPHFLQNTLNSISYFCLSDPEKAVETLERLSVLLRQSFKGGPQGWWPIAEEMKMIEAFGAIQKARHGERLSLIYDLADVPGEVEVPCFLIQPLVENGILYGLKQTVGEVTVHLKVRLNQMLSVTVTNPGQPLPKPFAQIISSEHATGNINKRLQAMFATGLTYRFEEGLHILSFVIDLDAMDDWND